MKIVPMTKDFILYRCIHVGPLGPENIDKLTEKDRQSTRDMFIRNKKFFSRLVETYGSCAMLAIENDLMIAHARFYPQIISELTGKNDMCCQQLKYAPTADMTEMDLPTFEELTDPSLRIYCWHVHKDYRNQGISHALLKGIIQWAIANGWKTILASAGVDDPWVASQSCAPMLRTYLKHGFEITSTVPSPELLDYLKKVRDGEYGVEGKEKLKKSLAGKNLSQAAVYYKVKKNL